MRRKDIRLAILYGKAKSAPGPGGLPSGVWRALGDLAVDIL